MPVQSTIYTDPGLGLFVGDFVNPLTPLWMSAYGPNNLGANLQVSTLAVNATGSITMAADSQPLPSTIFAPITFNRAPGRYNTSLKQNISKNVPTFFEDREYLTVTSVNGQIYDDAAVAGIQIFGFQRTDPLLNTGCAGRITQGSLPYSLRLDTARVETNDVYGNNAVFSSFNVSTVTVATTVFSTIVASTINAGSITTSTLNVSSFSVPANTQVSTLTALQGTFSSLTATDAKISSLNVSSISSFNTNTSNLNAGFTKTFFASTNSEAVNSSYISSLLANNIIAVTIQATDMNASVVRSGNIYGTNNASFVSTGNLIAPNTYTTSISTNNINASTFNTTIANVNLGNFSTLMASNYTAISTTQLVAANVSTNNVSTNTITANVATFSTLNAPAGSVTVSTVNTGLVSTTIANVKDIFVSTMKFDATLSPNFNLDMGGIIGGLIGYAGANTLSLGLGAAQLATGIGSLAMARQKGGINSNVFQTLNGTAQLQYSTLGTPTQTTFVSTDSADPSHIQGNIVYTSTFISSGTYCMRTISDPLNLANSAGQAGLGIQGYSEWTPVYPGFFSITQNPIGQTQLFDSATQNLINFGGGGGPLSTLTVFSPNRMNVTSSNEMNLTGASTLNIRASTINIFSVPPFPTTVSTTQINLIGSMNLTSTLQSKVLNVSTISGGTFPVQIIPGLNTSTLAVSSLTIGTSIQTNFQTSTLTVTGNAQFQQGVSFSSNTAISLANLSTASTTILSYSGGGIGVKIGNNPPTGPTLGGNDLAVTGQVYAGGAVTATTSGVGTSFIDGASLSINNGNSQFISNGSGGLTVSTVLGGTPNPFLDIVGSLFCKKLYSRGTSLADGWMSPNPPTSGVFGTQFGSMVLSGLLIQWGIANGGGPPQYYATWTFTYPYKTGTVPVVFFTTLTYSNVPSFASLVSVNNLGYVALEAQGPGQPFNTQVQWIAIGPAP